MAAAEEMSISNMTHGVAVKIVEKEVGRMIFFPKCLDPRCRQKSWKVSV